MVAVRKKLDLFGIIVLGVITAVGGGMLRDILIGEYTAEYVPQSGICAGCFSYCAGAFMLFRFWPSLLGSRYMESYERIMNILDAIGLGAFTVIGIDTGVEAGYGNYHFLIIFLGVITGIGGYSPILWRGNSLCAKKHIYACASIAGACLYAGLLEVSIRFGDDCQRAACGGYPHSCQSFPLGSSYCVGCWSSTRPVAHSKALSCCKPKLKP